MSPLVVRLLIIFAVTFVANAVRMFFTNRPVKKKVEIPSKVQRIGLGVQAVLLVLMALMALLGFVMRDAEMAIVSSVVTLIFATIVYFTRRKFKKFYEETDDSFTLKNDYIIYEVEYENIADWAALPKQIGVLDKTREGDYYICVNLAFAEPEILLRKLAEMTLAGKFEQSDTSQPDDPHREQELLNHLKKNGYGYIVEELSKA